MEKARNILVSLLVTLVGAGAVAAPAEAAAPMNIKIAPFAGSTVQVAKKLKVVVSCTRDCAARARVTLLTPAGNSTVSGSQTLAAGQGWITGMILTRYGLSILRNHYAASRLKVLVTARNLKNGTVRKKSKVFRFRR